ncbi:hypothetical protein ACSX1A_00595 [Pontibacter sp. MBLB2868]|uniref:hypothetical protein n=1 Tax=Pontibacter sp. MBLB2868 TaxID=3451555 RepID=UPI003F7503A8
MKTTKIFGSEPIAVNETYEYENAIARYNLTFVSEEEISTKYEILCHVDQVAGAISEEIDAIVSPDQCDILDLTLCAYEVKDFFGKIFYLTSYTVKVELAEILFTEIPQLDDTIQLPFFDVYERKRVVKSFNNFS